MNAIDEALAPKPEPSTPDERVRAVLAPGGGPLPLVMQSNLTTKRMLLERAGGMTKEAVKKLRGLHHRYVEVYAKLCELGDSSPAAARDAHLAEVSRRLVSGVSVEGEGWSVEEWREEKSALMDAHRSALKEISGSARSLLAPVLLDAADVAVTVLEEEADAFRHRCGRYGVAWTPGDVELAIAGTRRDLLGMATSTATQPVADLLSAIGEAP